MEARKVNAERGAQWVLDSLALIGHSPVRIGGVALVCGLLSSLPILGLFVAVYVAVMLRLMDHAAGTGTFKDGSLLSLPLKKVVRLLLFALIALLFTIASFLSLVAMVGAEGAEALINAAATGEGVAPMGPDVVPGVPSSQIALWAVAVLLGTLLVFACGFFLMFFYIPLITYTDIGAGRALRVSANAGIRNFSALLVLLFVLGVLVLGTFLACWILSSLVGYVTAEAVGTLTFSVLFNAVVVALIGGVFYFAWIDVLSSPCIDTAGNSPGSIAV